jgi:hypothetical protein
MPKIVEEHGHCEINVSEALISKYVRKLLSLFKLFVFTKTVSSFQKLTTLLAMHFTFHYTLHRRTTWREMRRP